MKKFILSALLFCGMFSLSYAQTTPATTNAKTEKDIKKSTGKDKNGSPDMRLKANKDAKANAKKAKTVVTPPTPAQKPATRVVTHTVKPAPVVTSPTVKPVTPPVKPVAPTVIRPSTTDKVIVTDDKGRTIYEGKKGGHYFINKNGNKEYVKKS